MPPASFSIPAASTQPRIRLRPAVPIPAPSPGSPAALFKTCRVPWRRTSRHQELRNFRYVGQNHRLRPAEHRAGHRLQRGVLQLQCRFGMYSSGIAFHSHSDRRQCCLRGFDFERPGLPHYRRSGFDAHSGIVFHSEHADRNHSCNPARNRLSRGPAEFLFGRDFTLQLT